MRSLLLKRVIDLLGAGMGLFLLSPLLLFLMVAVKMFLGSPVIFKQLRPGLKGVPFTFYKFRTMTNEIGANGKMLSDTERLTSLGKILRTSSLDELPSLFNVLTGEMSLVGPRPLLIEYKELYTPAQARRHDVKPGVTGWAQVNGRNSITWEEKFDLDIWYVDNHTFFLDIKILFLTIKKVLLREGINSQTSATMEKFNGSIPK